MSNYLQHIFNVDSSVKEALIHLNQLSGTTMVLFLVDEQQKIVGTLTDGDVRRALIRGVLLEDRIWNIINQKFHFLNAVNCSPSYIASLVERNIYLVPYLCPEGKIFKIYNFKEQKTILPVDVVMMAGGKGIRLRPLTDTIPKPLLKVGNKAIIDYNIDNLLYCGVEKFYITVNYLAQQIEQHFAQRADACYVCVKEDNFLGTIGAVALIDNFQNDIILVMNSDLFTNINFVDFYQSFIDDGADMAIATIPYNVNIPFAILELEGDSVKAFKEKPSFTYYANAGIYLIKKEHLSLIEKNVCFNATDLIQVLIDQGKKVTKYPIMGYWVDIGRHEDFVKVQEFAKHIN